MAPHRNKYSRKIGLKMESAICPPTGTRILLSLANIFNWCLEKIDIKSAFLQRGDTLKDFYVITPKEINDKRHHWLLLTSANGRVNARAKFLEQSDSPLTSFGMKQIFYVPQLCIYGIRILNLFLLQLRL